MDEEKQKQSDIFNDTVAKAVENQQERTQEHNKRIGIVEQEIQKLSGLPKDIAEIKDSLNLVKRNGITALLPNEKSEKLSENLSVAIPLIRQLIENKIQHHHYIPKLMWITAGLFVILCLTCVGWTMTSGKLDQYRASDTKYRKLKLLPDSVVIIYLNKLDSLYASNPDSLRGNVEQQERLKQERLELIDRIKQVNSQIETGEKGRP
jgi:hypothetical protein